MGKGKHFKKDVNKTLMYLLVLILVLFASFSVYYQTTLNQILKDSDKNKEHFEKLTAQLISEQSKSNQTLEVRENAQKDKETLEKLYADINSENREIKMEKESLQNDLSKIKNDLEDYKSKFNIINTQFKQVQDSLIKANDEISRLVAKNNELCSKIMAYENPEYKC